MSNEVPTCPKCNGAMTEGRRIDFTDTARWPAMWVAEGDAQAVFSHTNKDVSGYFASVYRCDDCGYLEQYAIHEAPIGDGDDA